jgi:hypothetical protein
MSNTDAFFHVHELSSSAPNSCHGFSNTSHACLICLCLSCLSRDRDQGASELSRALIQNQTLMQVSLLVRMYICVCFYLYDVMCL